MVKLRRLSGLVLVLGLGVVLSGARNPGGIAAPPAVGPQEVSVIGVFSDPQRPARGHDRGQARQAPRAHG